MTRTRIIVTTAAAAAVLAAPAQAANPYTPTGVCGPGYGVVGSHPIRGDGGGVLATTFVTWNASTQKNCAVTIKRRAVGVPTWTEVKLTKVGGRYTSQDGFFEYYAGPLYKKAPGTCITYGGGMRDAQGNGGRWITPRPVHCG